MYSKPKEKRTTVSISVSTRRELKEYGYFGESYDDIICRLMDKKKTQESKEDLTYKEKIEDKLV